MSAAVFVREYTRELHNKNAAVFAGAGLSIASGYVDWPGLLRELIQDLSEHECLRPSSSSNQKWFVAIDQIFPGNNITETVCEA